MDGALMTNKILYEKINDLNNKIKDIQQYTDVPYGIKNAVKFLSKEIAAFLTIDKYKTADIKTSELIQIGGGKNYLSGFINIDLCEPADIICDVREGLPLPDQSASFIYCEHFLEHLDYPISVELFLNECFRVLKTDGKIVIGVPNSTQAIDAYVNRDTEYYEKHKERWSQKKNAVIDSYIDIINYHFRDLVNHPKYTPHYWAYDEEKLENMLIRLGFKSAGPWIPDMEMVNPGRYQRTLYAEAKK